MSKLLATIAALALSAAPAAVAVTPSGYTDPLAKHGLHVSPSTAKPGQTVRLYGSAGSGCATGDTVTIYSRAFKGATNQNFAGVPSVSAGVASKTHKFSRKLKLSSKIKPGKYHVGARCGGGNLGAATLTVKK